MADLTEEQLAEWAALEAAATRGPWSSDGPWWYDDADCAEMVSGGDERLAVVIAPPKHARRGAASYSDIRFIAAARNAFPLLLRALRDARAEAWQHALCNDGCVPGAAYNHLREYAAKVAAERDALRAQIKRLEGAGRCGAAAPVVLPGAMQSRCDLRAGHAGWHESNDGSQWSVAAALAAPTGQEEAGE